MCTSSPRPNVDGPREPAPAPCVNPALLDALHAGAGELARLAAAMTHRLSVGTDAVCADTLWLCEELEGLRREVGSDALALSRSRDKELEAVGERDKVTGEQLLAYAMLLEEAAAGRGSAGSDWHAVCAPLLAYAADVTAAMMMCGPAPSPWYGYDDAIEEEAEEVWLPPTAVDSDDDEAFSSRLAEPDAALCLSVVAVTYPMSAVVQLCDAAAAVVPCAAIHGSTDEDSGLWYERPLEGEGRRSQWARLILHREDGSRISTLEDGDVSVRVEGGEAGPVCLASGGEVEVGYTLPEGCTHTLYLHATAFGMLVQGSPWSIAPSIDSNIMRGVGGAAKAEFVRALRHAWLPNKAFTLLYRASRDGATGAHFHEKCDGGGPTLTLIRCDKGWVFGGYADGDWQHPDRKHYPHQYGYPPNRGRYLPGANSFLFSVTGPHTPTPFRCPLKAGKHNNALYFHERAGPCFGRDLVVQCSQQVGMTNYAFDEQSCFGVVGKVYEDPTGEGGKAFTGSSSFVPAEIEVFSVL